MTQIHSPQGLRSFELGLVYSLCQCHCSKLGVPRRVAFVFQCVLGLRDPAQSLPACGTFAVYQHTCHKQVALAL